MLVLASSGVCAATGGCQNNGQQGCPTHKFTSPTARHDVKPIVRVTPGASQSSPDFPPVLPATAPVRADREQMTSTSVGVKVALVELALRVDHLDGSKHHRPLLPG